MARRPGTLRIVAGEQRGRLLRVPPGLGLRPTADRVREALFDILGPRVAGAVVLDPFAGTGALAFEALSRGAASATFCETDRTALDCLRHNAAALGFDERRCRVLAGPVEPWLARPQDLGGPFDLVLADPPYEEPAEPFLAALERSGVLAAGATVVVEREARRPLDLPGDFRLKLARTATYGRTALDFLRG